MTIPYQFRRMVEQVVTAMNGRILTFSGLNVGTATGATAGKVKTSGQLESTVATGTAPLIVASTTKVQNLNVELFEGLYDTNFVRRSDILSGNYNNWVAEQSSNSASFVVINSAYKVSLNVAEGNWLIGWAFTFLGHVSAGRGIVAMGIGGAVDDARGEIQLRNADYSQGSCLAGAMIYTPTSSPVDIQPYWKHLDGGTIYCVDGIDITAWAIPTS